MGMGCGNRKRKIVGYGNLVCLLASTERKWFFSVYSAFVFKLRVSKESKACQIVKLPAHYHLCVLFVFSGFAIFVVFVTRKEVSNH